MREICVSVFVAFMLSFVLMVTTQAQSEDTNFKAWLAGLNGSRWIIADNEDLKTWYELNGDTLTHWVYYKISGIKRQLESHKVDNKRFYLDTEIAGSIIEFSDDGYVLTTKVVRSEVTPGWVGTVTKCIKDN